MHVNYLGQDPIYRKHSLCAIVVIGKFLSVPRHLIKPVAPWGERISLFYLNQFVSPHGLSTEPGQQVLPDGPLLLPAVSAAGPCREGLSLWLWPFLPQPRLSSGNFPWQLPAIWAPVEIGLLYGDHVSSLLSYIQLSWEYS